MKLAIEANRLTQAIDVVTSWHHRLADEVRQGQLNGLWYATSDDVLLVDLPDDLVEMLQLAAYRDVCSQIGLGSDAQAFIAKRGNYRDAAGGADVAVDGGLSRTELQYLTFTECGLVDEGSGLDRLVAE